MKDEELNRLVNKTAAALEYEAIRNIVQKATEDAANHAREFLPKLGVIPDEMTITSITSFLIGRLPGAILNPKQYGYEKD